MNDIMRFFDTPIVRAIIWLMVALVVAAVARSVVAGIVRGTSLKRKIDQPSYTKTVGYAGKLAFLVVFMLFVPVIFSTLNVGDAAEPVFVFLDNVWGFLPNVLAAGIVLSVGMLAAQLVRQLLVPVFARMRLDRLQERAGIKVEKTARLSETLAYIVYVLIVIPVVIVALQVLNIEAISVPATNMLNTIIGFVPNIISALVIMVLGVCVARLAGNIVGQLVASAGIDAKAEGMAGDRLMGMSVSKIASFAVQAVIAVLFAVEALDLLELEVLTNVGNAVVAYLPNVLAAALVFAVASFVANMATKAIGAGATSGKATLVRGAIWVLAAIMVLSQLNIAPQIVQGGFLLGMGAVAVAFALAFGLGGRDFARQSLQKLEGADPANAGQSPATVGQSPTSVGQSSRMTR